MEVAAAVGTIVGAPLLFRAIRTKFTYSVECWFCHSTTRVKYEERNSFTCPSCEQYNGFNEDGDYNRRIPEQQLTRSKQFCERVKKDKMKKRDGLLDRLNGVNMSPKEENGLCSECNMGQEIIMRKVAEFEPIDEERWNEELEDYRYKLERMYQLCPRCTIAVHGKLEEDKLKYSHLLNVKYKLKNAIGSVLKDAIVSSKKKSRKFFFAGGPVCESLHFLCLLASSFLFLATIDFLQHDAGASLINVPKIIRDHLPSIYSSSLLINSLILFSHLIAAYNNKSRVTLPDLLLPILLIISMLTLLLPDDKLSQDVALIRCACASFSSILSMAVTLLPRKRLHKKKPNKIISSAFSIASTPISQCSSQNSRNASLLEDTLAYPNRSRSPFERTPSASPPNIMSTSPKNLFRDLTNSSTWANRIRENKENDRGEAMDWDDSESVAISTRTASSSFFRPGILNRNPAPSMTSHQQARSVASASFLGTARPFESPTPSVFSRQHRQVMQEQNMTSARSLFGSPARSLVASNVERNHYLPDTNTRSGSVFTSVSQQDDGHSTVSGAWQCRVLAILFALVFIVLIMQIALFYVLFTRK